MNKSFPRRIAQGTLALAVTISLAGCVTNEELGNPEGWKQILPEADPALAAQVPPKIRDKGTISVGTNIPYAPNEFKDSQGKIIGFEMDIIKAAAATLGLKAEPRQQDFSLILPSIAGGALDVGASAFTDTEERQKEFDFVDFFSAGIAWATQPGNEGNVDPNNACGLRVAVQKGTYSDTDEVQGRSEECVAQGKPPIEKLVYEKADAAATATILKKSDAYSSDSSVIDYAINRANGKLVAIGEPFDTAPFGIAVKKGSPMGPLIAQAIQKMIDDGSYLQILTLWGLEKGGLSEVTFNLQPLQRSPRRTPRSTATTNRNEDR